MAGAKLCWRPEEGLGRCFAPRGFRNRQLNLML
jgi:hypothetical protein